MDEREELIELSGRVSSVLFRNEENGYTVLKLTMTDEDPVTVVGIMPNAVPGVELDVFGQWTVHPNHGSQFKAELSQMRLPNTPETIYEYLAGGAISGIGPVTAALIVDRFGAKALNVVENEPGKLAEIKGISLKKANSISAQAKRRSGLRNLMEFMSGFQLRPILAVNIYKLYGEDSLHVIQEDPYIITSVSIGGSFREADMLALEFGLEADSPSRVRAAIIHEMRFNAERGHCFIPYEKLKLVAARYINVPEEAAADGISLLEEDHFIVRRQIAGEDAYYLTPLNEAEASVAARLREMALETHSNDRLTAAKISELEKICGIKCSREQLNAVKLAAESSVMVITGGPGTGKTTALSVILKLYDSRGIKTLLTAPTGRAAKRMTEVTGREASTVHRLLGAAFAGDGEDVVFARDESDPLDCGAVILDESSMVDITLINALLLALPQGCRLIMVGDVDQLPSIGPGNVLRDVLRSDIIPAVRLTEIFRQGEGSRIVSYAHSINRGEHPELSENKGDFFFLKRDGAEKIAETVIDLCSRRLPEGMGILPQDIQVLSPTRRGDAGTVSLNKRLQSALNPSSEQKNEKTFGELVFRVGDRVMQSRNNYDIIWRGTDGIGAGVFNGAIGYIIGIDLRNETMEIDFDGNIAIYSFELLQELEHAWAITVHKSQGSEYKAVVLSVSDAAASLMTRSLLYTAITRAKELFIAVGDERTVHKMIDDNRVPKRYSGLRARLCEEVI